MPYDLRIGERCEILPAADDGGTDCTGHHCTVDVGLGSHFGFMRGGDIDPVPFLSYDVTCDCGYPLWCSPDELRRLHDPPAIPRQIEHAEVA